MITNIEVLRSHDDLNEERWTFWFNDSNATLVLDTYRRYSRPTRRHKWTVEDSYNRLDRRGTTAKLEDVPWSESIEREAMGELFRRIRVVKGHSTD